MWLYPWEMSSCHTTTHWWACGKSSSSTRYPWTRYISQPHTSSPPAWRLQYNSINVFLLSQLLRNNITPKPLDKLVLFHPWLTFALSPVSINHTWNLPFFHYGKTKKKKSGFNSQQGFLLIFVLLSSPSSSCTPNTGSLSQFSSNLTLSVTRNWVRLVPTCDSFISDCGHLSSLLGNVFDRYWLSLSLGRGPDPGQRHGPGVLVRLQQQQQRQQQYIADCCVQRGNSGHAPGLDQPRAAG